MTGRRMRVAVAGGSGYGGAETLRWLADHPTFEVCAVTSRSSAGKGVDAVHPHLAGFHERLRFVAEPTDALASEPDAFVLALPHREAASWARKLLDAKPTLRIADLSGDHRLGDAAAYRSAYGADHPNPDDLASGRWVFGLPEANRDRIRGSQCVANPGCFSTGALLGALPLAKAGLIAGPVRHVAVTGSSGSGIEPAAGTHHPERAENVRAYKVLDHQHVPEMTRCLAAHGMPPATPWWMVPQSGPFARGIFTTLMIPLARPQTTDELRAVFASEYADDPFVRMRSDTPQVIHVRGTNFCDVAVRSAGSEAVVLTAIDNLGKGMVTQAVQNLNLMFGLDEAAGLRRPGGRP
ncbi:MAG: N-acetyl-gamma-glutamyl-phosphate reductase [Planctomycetes bacterium]|nr:N-acetyl-gamma-glutamyl-phosphate reductase [Planctomycetota bacterium]